MKCNVNETTRNQIRRRVRDSARKNVRMATKARKMERQMKNAKNGKRGASKNSFVV